jgi:hypothetical protein
MRADGAAAEPGGRPDATLEMARRDMVFTPALPI